MISLIATLKVKPGKMDEAVQALREAVPRLRAAEPGCLAYVPHRVKGEDNTIIFYEKYADKDALKVHMANMGTSLEKLLPLLEPGMEVKTCFEILE